MVASVGSTSMQEMYLRKILKANVYDVAQKTPLDYANILSAKLDNHIFMKREDLQQVFSFKLRGAYNKMAQLSNEERQCGVIAASAGNHAQGVALSAHRFGISAMIVMPETTPAIKINSVKAHGAEVILYGDTYDEAASHAIEIASSTGKALVHPYDDPDVIAGQGTIAMEILQQMDDRIDAIFVPVGGGGLIAGISVYIKQLYPDTKIIGVEPQDAPSMYEALKKGERVVLDQVGIFADGVAVRQVGKETFKVAQECVDEVVLVSTDEICAAIKDIYDDTRSIVEPAGALAIAGIKKYVANTSVKEQQLIAINSGANINFDRLRHVAERAEIGEQREVLLAVTIPERPGSFRQFCKLVGHRSITEFNYRYASDHEAHVFVGIEASGGEEARKTIIKVLESNDYAVVDLTDNEMAKLHVRYMVGGHGRDLNNEVLYRFEFPERPGALFQFLERIGENWNISLFHYRNHGSAYGRILAGLQVSSENKAEFSQFLKDLGYTYCEEHDNPAYNLFLGSA